MVNCNFLELGDGDTFGIALSGGGDSLALLFLLLEKLPAKQIVALHFDHSIRANSHKDVSWITRVVEPLGVKLVVGKWGNIPTNCNIQQAARKARYEFLCNAATEHNLAKIFIGHSEDDVAETVLMRLARGSGLKGLASMESEFIRNGINFSRPLLENTRTELREYLQNKEQKWLDDPSNENEAFFRVRMRNLRPTLEKAGIEFRSIAAAAKSLRRADDALEVVVVEKLVQFNNTNGLSLKFLDEPDEIALRILDKIMQKITGNTMSPRTSKRLRAINIMRNGEFPLTLGGCIFKCSDKNLLIELELSKCSLRVNDGQYNMPNNNN